MNTRDTVTQADRWRIALTIVTVALELGATFFPALTGIGTAIGDGGVGDRTALVPATYAFAIWGPIFLGHIVYAVYQATPAKRTHPLLRRIGWQAIGSFSLLFLFSTVAAFDPPYWVTAPLLVPICACLLPLLIEFGTAPRRPNGRDRLLIHIPLAMFAGWTLIALFLAWSTVVRVPALARLGLSETELLAIVLFLAAAAAATMVFVSRANLTFTLTVAWGLAGIVVANAGADGERRMLAVIAGCLIVLLLLGWYGARRLVASKRVPNVGFDDEPRRQRVRADGTASG